MGVFKFAREIKLGNKDLYSHNMGCYHHVDFPISSDTSKEGNLKG